MTKRILVVEDQEDNPDRMNELPVSPGDALIGRNCAVALDCSDARVLGSQGADKVKR